MTAQTFSEIGQINHDLGTFGENRYEVVNLTEKDKLQLHAI